MILSKYILYILKKVSCVIPPSNEPCVDSALEPNIESELLNVVIRGRIVCRKLGKILQILGEILYISVFIIKISVRVTYADTLHLSSELAKGDPKVRVSNYVHHLDILGKGGSKEKH